MHDYGRKTEEVHNFFQKVEPEDYSLRQMLIAEASNSALLAPLWRLRIYIFKNPVKGKFI